MKKSLKFSHMIAANSGFAVLEALNGAAGQADSINASPVVAWALETGTFAPYPITLEGVQTENVAILRPDGKVEYPCSSLFLDTAEWLDWQRDHTKKKRGAA